MALVLPKIFVLEFGSCQGKLVFELVIDVGGGVEEFFGLFDEVFEADGVLEGVGAGFEGRHVETDTTPGLGFEQLAN